MQPIYAPNLPAPRTMEEYIAVALLKIAGLLRSQRQIAEGK